MDEELLRSEVLVMTGGRDNYGHQILTFTPRWSDKLSSHTSAAHLVIVAQYLMRTLDVPTQRKGLAFLANLRTASKESVQMVVETLDKIQLERQGTVYALFAVQPKSKDLQKTLKKLVGLKASKKNPKAQIYQTILFSDITELGKHIDGSQLTSEFGGSLRYDHSAWIQFTKSQNAFEGKVKRTLAKVPDATDRIHMTLEYEIPEGQKETQDLVLQIRQKYQDIMRDLNLEHTIDECKAIYKKLHDPEQSPEYKDLWRTPSFLSAQRSVHMFEKELIDSREELKSLWQKAEARIMMSSKVQKYIQKGDKVLEWIKEVGTPAVNQDPEIADCLSKAEIHKTHFETGFYSVAKNVLWLCGKIQKKLNEVILETKGESPDLLKYSKKFQGATNYFAEALDKKLQVYLNVHNFFLNSNKITKWYQRALRFLPLQLLRQTGTVSNGRQTVVFQITAAWKAAVENFLLHHPAPKPQHLQKLKNVIPVIDSINIRNQARLLVHRTEVVTQLLYNAGKISLSEMQEVMRWKEQISQGHDEITLNFASSTLDLSRIGDLEPMFGAGISHANSTQSLHSNTSRAPKLKVAPAMDEAEYGEGPYYSLDRKQVLGQRLALADSGYHTTGRKPKSRSKSANISVYDARDYSASLPRQRARSSNPGLGTPGMGSSERPAHHRSVPRLDLGYSDSPEFEQPKLSLLRSDSSEILTSPKSTEGLSSDGGQERYVSLGEHPLAGQSQTLPPSLQHLNVQSLQEGSTQPTLKRYDSITDSGIANSRSDGTNRSHNSINTTGLSPVHQPRPGLLPKQESQGALSHHRSLPNLFNNKAQLDRQLTEKQNNIDLIAGSDLTAEEKLNLMAAMCDNGELELNPETSYKLQVQPAKGKAPLNPNSSVRPKSAGATKAAPPAKPPRKNLVKNGAMSKSTETLTPSSRNSSLKVAQASKSPANSRRNTLTAATGPELSLKPSNAASDTQTSVSETTATTAIHRADTTIEGTSTGAVSRTGSKKYGIDVAEWVSQQDPHDVSSIASSDLLSQTDGMENQVQKLRAAKHDRKAEEEELRQERQRLKQISIEEAALGQDEVERTLRRTEKMLQKQEAMLNARRDDSIDEDTPPPLPKSPPPGDDEIEAIRVKPVSKRGGRSGPQRQYSQDKSGKEHDGSVSEESGVYTQASSDSRHRADDQRNSPPTGTTTQRPTTPRLSQPYRLSEFEIEPVVGKRKSRSPVLSAPYNRKSEKMKLQEKEKYAPVRNLKQMTVQEIDIDGDFREGTDEQYTSTSTLQDISDHLGNSSAKLVVEEPIIKPVSQATSKSSLSKPLDTVKVDSVDSKPKCNGHVDPIREFFNTELTIREVTEADNIQPDMYEEVITSGYEKLQVKPEVSKTTVKPQAHQSNHYSDEKMRTSYKSDSGQNTYAYAENGVLSSQYPVSSDTRNSLYSGGGECVDYDLIGQTYSTENLNLKTPVIIDNGSGLCKCGLANQDRPYVFPAYVGRPKYEEAMSNNLRENYVGESATNMRGVLKLRYPLEHGIITDWNDMELIWSHALNDQLRINPEEHPIMVTEAPMNPKKSRERMLEVLFETFDAPAMYVAIQAVLALYASGRTTGVVFDCGDGVSHIVPVYEGCALPHATSRINLAGRDLTDHLIKLLRESGVNFTTSAEREIARDIKEQHCYIAEDFQAELRKAESSSKLEEFYTLPDGQTISLNSERFRCPEALFHPAMLGYESHGYGGIHEAIYNSVARCDIDLRRDLFSNVLLSGGTTNLPGLAKRIHNEISSLCPPALSSSVKVSYPADRQFLVWQGGAVLSTLPSFSSSWVFYEEYQEVGSDIIHRKCF